MIAVAEPVKKIASGTRGYRESNCGVLIFLICGQESSWSFSKGVDGAFRAKNQKLE
jgi:hypothetical protein